MIAALNDDKSGGSAAAKGPGTRRVARELALRMLFQRDMDGCSADATARSFEASFSPEKDEENGLEIEAGEFSRAWPLAKELFFGVCTKLAELDAGIAKAAANWSIGRMSPVDRGLIRLAYYEMIYRDEIPPKVSLNEALEIAKTFGDADSSAFINGVLDKLMRQASSAGAVTER